MDLLSIVREDSRSACVFWVRPTSIVGGYKDEGFSKDRCSGPWERFDILGRTGKAIEGLGALPRERCDRGGTSKRNCTLALPSLPQLQRFELS